MSETPSYLGFVYAVCTAEMADAVQAAAPFLTEREALPDGSVRLTSASAPVGPSLAEWMDLLQRLGSERHIIECGTRRTQAGVQHRQRPPANMPLPPGGEIVTSQADLRATPIPRPDGRRPDALLGDD